jgi:DNA-directed RNA polymerase specialized sigma subunit
MNLHDLFTYTDADLSLSEADEIQAIEDAQAGDDNAKERLLLAYGPAIRSAVFRFAKGVRAGRDPHAGGNGSGTAAFDEEDARNTALVAFLETLQDHDATQGTRLAGLLPTRLTRALSDLYGSVMPFEIPERTLSRYYGILQAAEGDAEVAVEIAPEHHMTRETFRAVLAAVRGTGSLQEGDDLDATHGARIDGAESLFGGGAETLADVEDAILVEEAFRAVDDEEARIVELAYGFRGTEDYAAGDPVPDAAIAPVVGLTRPTVQRKRSGALGKMRKALGALEESDWK